jgi:ParB-like chromosome segregation protein Spo0J
MHTTLHTKTVSEIKAVIAEINDLTVLADNLGELKILIAELEAKADIFSDELKARLDNDDRVIGSSWTVLKSQPKESSRLDTKKLEADLGKETLAGYYKPIKNSPRITVTATKLWEVAA